MLRDVESAVVEAGFHRIEDSLERLQNREALPTDLGTITDRDEVSTDLADLGNRNIRTRDEDTTTPLDTCSSERSNRATSKRVGEGFYEYDE